MDCANGKETLQKVECTPDICSDKGKSPRTKENKKVLITNKKWEITRPNSALDLCRGCTSLMCLQSICKVQINRNEIRLHPKFTM